MSDIDPISFSPSPKHKALEALLFAAPGMTTLDQLAQGLGVSKKDTEKYLLELTSHYETEHGIRIQRMKDSFQLTTAADHGEAIEKFLNLESSARLTQAALETLAIVAYKQPATRPEVDAIRGVNSEAVIKNLLSKGLIEEQGRSEAPGRPILYAVTPEFLQSFGLDSLDQLPEVDLEQLENKALVREGDEQRLLKD